jgi:uncharacterized protein YbjT (DUF2867 family)
MQSSPVLVTGATGNVGHAVVRDLLASGMQVRAAVGSERELGLLRDRFPDGGSRLEGVVLDFTDPGTWSAYAGVERVFLMRPPHLGRPRTQMLPSLEAMRAAGVGHVVFLSLQGAGRNPVVPHATIEQWLRDSGLGWTFVRASFFMQNLTTTHAADIRERDELVVPAGRGGTAFVDAADVGSVAAAVLLDPQPHTGRVWTPTGPQALTYAQVTETLSHVLQRPVDYRAPGALRYARHARRRLAMPWGMVVVTTAIYTAARLGQAAGLTDDVRTVLGRDPVGFAEFAREHRAVWVR